MTSTAIDPAEIEPANTPEPEEIEPARFARPGPARPEQPIEREDDPPADVPRDQWDRPLIVLPDGSDIVAYVRASKYGKLIEDYYTLHRWDERNIVWGMSRGRHLVVRAQSVREQTGREAVATLQDIAERAKLLAGADAGALTGTGLHKLSERRDAGEDLSYLDPMTMLGREIDPNAPVVVIGGYSACRDHVAPVAAVAGGRDWPALLVIVGLSAREAQNNPRPPGVR